MAVLSYYYFGEKTNDDVLTLREEERRSQGLRYNVSSCAYDRISTCICIHANAVSLFVSLSLSLRHVLAYYDTDHAENIGTPYAFPETRFIEAITPTIRAKTKTSL